MPITEVRVWARMPQAGCLLPGIVLALWLVPSTPVYADQESPGPRAGGDFTDMTLEELMGIEVTSVSKRPQKRSQAPAAVFVITQRDLRRWAVTNIPDALRMVPGLEVARIDTNKWAITSRGFNSRFANKLLVLVDGRSIYTPLFAGVYWEIHEPPLQNIERIEVIRGPGGSLWGANAVNGVINIITRDAQDTQGGLVSVSAGNEVRDSGILRYGGELPNGGHYRIYGTQNHDRSTSSSANDDLDQSALGFRADWSGADRDVFTLQGDYYTGSNGQQITTATDTAPFSTSFKDDVDVSGGNLLLRWKHVLDDSSDIAFQAYFDHVKRDGAVLFEDRDTFDFDFQHHVQWGARHDILWGLGYRRVSDDTENNPNFSLDPSNRSVDLFSGFLQDEISLLEGDLALTLGTKIEKNDFTDFEYQPNIRVTWTPNEWHTLWGAVSRAVRTPARGESDVRLRVGTIPPPPAATPIVLLGNDEFDSEHLWAYELGYRVQDGQTWSIDIATFFNDYDHLRTFDAEIMPPPELGLPFDNRMDGHTYGVELAGQWQVHPRLRLQAGYNYLKMDLNLKDGSMDALSQGVEDASPRHQATLWSALDVTNNVEFDTILRYVDNVKTPLPGAESYTELDVRLAWTPVKKLELSLVGRNLLSDQHPEFQPDFIQTQPTEVKRSAYASLSWWF